MTGAHDPDNRRQMRFDNALSVYEKETLEYVQKLNAVRAKYSMFRYGDVIPLKVEEEVFVYALSDFNGKAIVVIPRNKTAAGEMISIPEYLNIKSLKNAFTGDKIKVQNNSFSTDISSYNGMIFVSE